MKSSEFAKQPLGVILNQPKPLGDLNLFTTDAALADAVQRSSAGWATSSLSEYGELLGRAETLALGPVANSWEPRLITHGADGSRRDVVEFHPAYHQLMALGIDHGLHALPWSTDRAGSHVARGAMMHLRHQVEQGTSCPMTMTFAVVPSLQLQEDVAAQWLPKILAHSYDPRFAPADQKTGLTVGMFLTERQGGSDVRSNNTVATPTDVDGEYTIEGHKWFCSAPMSDAFLVLAQAPEGLTCFFMPRWRPDGTLNSLYIQRLKDKLGNRSNASSEIEIKGAWAQRVGEPGRGVRTIIEMIRHTRLDCAFGGNALIRRSVIEAIHFTRQRWAFGARLSDHALMKNVLADLCLESEAATALTFRLASSFDGEKNDPVEAAFSRVSTSLTKYWVTKRETEVAREALECFGGNGYIMDQPIAQLFRESPLNSIWEGAGNVQCLDLLRALEREPAAMDAYFGELAKSAGMSPTLDRAVAELKSSFADRDTLEMRARRVVESMALTLQASLLTRHAPPAVSEAFVRSRLGGEHGRALGTLPVDVAFDEIIERTFPA